jgi:hypothetical protein
VLSRACLGKFNQFVSQRKTQQIMQTLPSSATGTTYTQHTDGGA